MPICRDQMTFFFRKDLNTLWLCDKIILYGKLNQGLYESLKFNLFNAAGTYIGLGNWSPPISGR